MAAHSSILAWRIHGQRSLAGYTVHGVARAMTDDLTQGHPKIQSVAFFKILYWITVDLQCCVSFKCAH